MPVGLKPSFAGLALFVSSLMESLWQHLGYYDIAILRE